MYTMPGVRFAVAIKSATRLEVQMSGGYNFFRVTLKGTKNEESVSNTTVSISQNFEWYSLASGLDPNSEYRVEVSKMTEPELRTVLSSFKPVEVESVRTDGTFCEVNSQEVFYPNGWMEVIGDSDACGFGVRGPASHATNIFSMDPAAQDVDSAWGSLVGKQLGLGCVTVAWSGKGIVQNAAFCGEQVLPDIWREAHDTSFGCLQSQPRFVLMLAGGNDFYSHSKPSRKTFRKGLCEFVEEIRIARGKEVPIFVFTCSSSCTSSAYPLQTSDDCRLLRKYTEEAISEMRNVFVIHLDINLTFPEDYGIMMHWNIKGQTKIANEMVKQMSLVTSFRTS